MKDKQKEYLDEIGMFINEYHLRSGFRPSFEDRKDYRTNELYFYDYLAKFPYLMSKIFELLKILSARNILESDSSTINQTKNGNWLPDENGDYQDEITITDNIIFSTLSKSLTVTTLNGSKTYNLSNSSIEFSGLYSPDYKEMILDILASLLDLQNRINDIESAINVINNKIIELQNQINIINNTLPTLKTTVTQGNNISVTSNTGPNGETNYTINSTVQPGASYTAGNGININNNVISAITKGTLIYSGESQSGDLTAAVNPNDIIIVDGYYLTDGGNRGFTQQLVIPGIGINSIFNSLDLGIDSNVFAETYQAQIQFTSNTSFVTSAYSKPLDGVTTQPISRTYRVTSIRRISSANDL